MLGLIVEHGQSQLFQASGGAVGSILYSLDDDIRCSAQDREQRQNQRGVEKPRP